MNQKKNDAPYLSEGNLSVQRDRQERRSRGEGSGKSRRGLFLLADVFLLVAVVVAAFFLVVLLTPLDLFEGADNEERSVTYAVELVNVDSELLGQLHVGDTVTDAETGSVIGVVAAIADRDDFFAETPGTVFDEALQTYVVTKNTYPENYKTLTVTIETVADYEKGVGYTAEDCRIAIGLTYDLRFPSYTGKGVCVSFEAKEVAE